MRFPNDTDLRRFQQHLNSIIEKHRREEQYMTITITDQAVNRPTLDTPEGTILRLTNNAVMSAPVGALAVVGDGSKVDEPARWLDVRWIKDQGSQMDGGYPPHVFEIHEFQVGDRVEVVGTLSENGYEGMIEAIPAHNSDDCIVAVEDNGLSLSYKFGSLKKVHTFVSDFPEKDDLDDVADYEEPLADWELELLGTPDTEPKAGDVVVIDAGEQFAQWNGLRFPLKEANPDWMPDLANGVIDYRPDGHHGDFFWDYDKLRAFDPARDFRVGDTVESKHYANAWNVDTVRGKVVTLDRVLGGDLTVDWTVGPERLTDNHPLGAFREHLTVVKGAPIVTIEGFGFEVDQEIGSSDVLGDLPVGTVLIVNGDEASPVVTLTDGRFGRVNRYGVKGYDQFSARAYFEDEAVVWAADSDEATLVIGFLPSDA